MARPSRPDYFAPVHGEVQALLRRVKGNTRRKWVIDALQRGEGLHGIPHDMLGHDLSGLLKGMLQRLNPQARGGEDLPDLARGEVEIARITLVDSVHGEVFSVRARPVTRKGLIELRVVDEYETDIALPTSRFEQPLTTTELLRLLAGADPSPLVSSCQLRLDSEFYPRLDELAERLKVKRLESWE
jgi:hypothetical protein